MLRAGSGVRLGLPLAGTGCIRPANTCLKLRANLVPAGELGDPTVVAIAQALVPLGITALAFGPSG